MRSMKGVFNLYSMYFDVLAYWDCFRLGGMWIRQNDQGQDSGRIWLCQATISPLSFFNLTAQTLGRATEDSERKMFSGEGSTVPAVPAVPERAASDVSEQGLSAFGKNSSSMPDIAGPMKKTVPNDTTWRR
jgi:hypothetical protein